MNLKKSKKRHIGGLGEGINNVIIIIILKEIEIT